MNQMAGQTRPPTTESPASSQGRGNRMLPSANQGESDASAFTGDGIWGQQ